MFDGYQNIDELTRNLIDAGCSEDTIDDCLTCLLHGDKTGSLCRLEAQRKELLYVIHKEQSCMEYLDELLDSLQRKAK